MVGAETGAGGDCQPDYLDQLTQVWSQTMGIEVPSAWEAAAAAILSRPGLTMVWGGSDRGKSTFCRYILAQAQERGVQLAFVDSDLGQGHFGPPAALALKLFPVPAGRLEGDKADALHFIGQTSPPGVMLEVVLGLRRLVSRARRQARRILVNTSGLVQGPLGQRLKAAKVEALQPRLIVALARDQELEPLLRPVRQGQMAEILELPVAAAARTKSWTERRQNREARFAAYFAGARSYLLAAADYGWLGFPFGQGEPLPLPLLQELGALVSVPILYGERTGTSALLLLDGGLLAFEEELCRERLGVENLYPADWNRLRHRLVGLLDQSFNTLALGIILAATWQPLVVTILSPLAPALRSQVAGCRLGRLRLLPSGRELPRGVEAPEFEAV